MVTDETDCLDYTIILAVKSQTLYLAEFRCYSAVKLN